MKNIMRKARNLSVVTTVGLLLTGPDLCAATTMQRFSLGPSWASFGSYRLVAPQAFLHQSDPLNPAGAMQPAQPAEPQVKDDLFAGAEKFAKGAKSSTEINLDPSMLAMAGEKADGSDLIKKMRFVFIRTYEYAKAGEYNMADVLEYTKRLEEGGWSHLVRERSDKEISDICVRSDPKSETSEMVIIDAEPKELTFVHMKGRMSMGELMKAGSKYGAPPADPKPERRK